MIHPIVAIPAMKNLLPHHWMVIVFVISTQKKIEKRWTRHKSY